MLRPFQLAHFHATRVRSFKLPETEALQCSWRRLLPSSHSSSSSLASRTPLSVVPPSNNHPSSLHPSTTIPASPCDRHEEPRGIGPAASSSSPSCACSSSSSPFLGGGVSDSAHGSTVSGEIRSSHEKEMQEIEGASTSSLPGSKSSLNSCVSCFHSSAKDRCDSLGSTSSSSSHPPAASHSTCSCVLCRAQQWGCLAMKSQADAELLTLEAEAVAAAAVEEVAEAEREIKALRKGEGRTTSAAGGELRDEEIQRTNETERLQQTMVQRRSQDDLRHLDGNKIRSKKEKNKLDNKGEADDDQRQSKGKAIDSVYRRTPEKILAGTGMPQEREGENAVTIEESPEDRAMEAAEFLAETATVAVDEAKEIVGELGHLELHHYQQERKILQEVKLRSSRKT